MRTGKSLFTQMPKPLVQHELSTLVSPELPESSRPEVGDSGRQEQMIWEPGSQATEAARAALMGLYLTNHASNKN